METTVDTKRTYTLEPTLQELRLLEWGIEAMFMWNDNPSNCITLDKEEIELLTDMDIQLRALINGG